MSMKLLHGSIHYLQLRGPIIIILINAYPVPTACHLARYPSRQQRLGFDCLGFCNPKQTPNTLQQRLRHKFNASEHHLRESRCRPGGR